MIYRYAVNIVCALPCQVFYSNHDQASLLQCNELKPSWVLECMACKLAMHAYAQDIALHDTLFALGTSTNIRYKCCQLQDGVLKCKVGLGLVKV